MLELGFSNLGQIFDIELLMVNNTMDYTFQRQVAQINFYLKLVARLAQSSQFRSITAI